MAEEVGDHQEAEEDSEEDHPVAQEGHQVEAEADHQLGVQVPVRDTLQEEGPNSWETPLKYQWRAQKDTIVPLAMGDLLGSQLSNQRHGTTLQSGVVLPFLHPGT